MTREEASKTLTQYIDYDAETPDYYEMEKACKVAIKVLEQIPDLKEAYNKGYKDGQEALAYHLELCKEEAEPCEDYISREQAIRIAEQGQLLGYEWQFKELCKLSSIQPKPKTDVLDKIRAEIIDTGAYEQEVNGKTEFLKGINYCLGVIDKYKAESEVNNGNK